VLGLDQAVMEMKLGEKAIVTVVLLVAVVPSFYSFIQFSAKFIFSLIVHAEVRLWLFVLLFG